MDEAWRFAYNIKILSCALPVYNNPNDFPQEKFVSYSWASIFSFAFGIFFWFHTVRWKILSFYVFMMILTFCLPPPYYFFWPLILKFIDLYFAMLAPRICHERWKKRGYRIAEESYEQIPRWYITFLKSLYKLPSLWLFWIEAGLWFNSLTFILMKCLSWSRVQDLPYSSFLAYWYKPGRLKSERHLLTSILYWVHFIFFLDASRMHSLYVLNLLCWFWMSPSAYAVSGTPRKKKRVSIETRVMGQINQ